MYERALDIAGLMLRHRQNGERIGMEPRGRASARLA